MGISEEKKNWSFTFKQFLGGGDMELHVLMYA